MSAEENVNIVRRIYHEVFDNHNVAVVDELFAPNYVYHAPGYPLMDREGLKQGFTQYLTAFPDSHMVIEDIFCAGDKVASRFVCTGTHQKPYLGIPATGKRITFTSILIQYLSNGKVVEDWEWSNDLEIMQQLGVVNQST